MHDIITSRLLILLFLFLIAAPVAHSQTDSATTELPLHLWSLDFAIEKDFRLDAFLGTALSISRFITPSEKIRVGLSTSLGVSDFESDRRHYAADTLSYFNDYDNSKVNHSIQLSVQYLSYTSSNAPTSGYIGVGPLVQYDRLDQELVESYDDPDSRTYHSVYRNSTVSVGVLASVGAEWFFSEHMSLHAEYGLQAFYFWSTSSDQYGTTFHDPSLSYANYRNETSGSGHGWSVRGSKVLFGISVKF